MKQFDRKILDAVIEGALAAFADSDMQKITERDWPIIVAVTAMDAVAAIAN